MSAVTRSPMFARELLELVVLRASLSESLNSTTTLIYRYSQHLSSRQTDLNLALNVARLSHRSYDFTGWAEGADRQAGDFKIHVVHGLLADLVNKKKHRGVECQQTYERPITR